MRKSEILAALERMPGDPDIQVKIKRRDTVNNPVTKSGDLDRINEYPRPEIVVIEK